MEGQSYHKPLVWASARCAVGTSSRAVPLRNNTQTLPRNLLQKRSTKRGINNTFHRSYPGETTRLTCGFIQEVCQQAAHDSLVTDNQDVLLSLQLHDDRLQTLHQVFIGLRGQVNGQIQTDQPRHSLGQKGWQKLTAGGKTHPQKTGPWQILQDEKLSSVMGSTVENNVESIFAN